MLATLCYAARRRTSFNCACYVLKGLRATPCRRGDSSCSRRPFDASWLLIYNICCVVVKCVLNWGRPPLSCGHFPRTAGETLPPVRPVTLTLALSHQGRGDAPLTSLRLCAPLS